jgi:metal-responsive CopG/Arc/MetJ family transcriptional regulator
VRYDRVILCVVKTAISLPDTTFARVEQAARRLGVSRSEFFARAAERWLDDLDEDQTTDAINQALVGVAQDTSFTDAAADWLVRRPSE